MTLFDKLPKKQKEKLIVADMKDQLEEDRHARLFLFFIAPLLLTIITIVIIVNDAWLASPVLYFAWFPLLQKTFKELKKDFARFKREVE